MSSRSSETDDEQIGPDYSFCWKICVLDVYESMSKIQYSSNSTLIIQIHLAVIPQLPHGIHPVVTFSCYLEF